MMLLQLVVDVDALQPFQKVGSGDLFLVGSHQFVADHIRQYMDSKHIRK